MGLVHMVFKSFSCAALLSTILTSVCECKREMLGFYVVPHVVSSVVEKLIAKSTAIAFLSILGNIQHQVIRGSGT